MKRDDERLSILLERLQPFLGQLSNSKHKRLWTRPRIPGSALHEALRAFAPDAPIQRVLALCDTTQLKTARHGYLVTAAAVYWRTAGSDGRSLPFADVLEVAAQGRGADRILVVTTPAGKVEINAVEANLSGLKKFLEAVLAARVEGLIDDVERYVVVQALTDAHKLGYVQAVISGSTTGGPAPLTASTWQIIARLMARLEVAPEVRTNAADLLVAPPFDTASWFEALARDLPASAARALLLSILKDAIALGGMSAQELLTSDAATARPLAQLAKAYAVPPEQVELLVEASSFDRSILDPEADFEAVSGRARELQAEASRLDVPLAAAFLSGASEGADAVSFTAVLGDLDLAGVIGIGAAMTPSGELLAMSSAGSAPRRRSDTETTLQACRKRLEQQRDAVHDRVAQDLHQDLCHLSDRMVEQANAKVDKARIADLSRAIHIAREANG